jgi:hypothetical protein
MFFTSAITSILPYILFFGIICTYYLGITNENITFYKHHEGSVIISNTIDHEADQHFKHDQKKHSLNTVSDLYFSKSDYNLYPQDDIVYEITYPISYINLNKEDLQFFLFSRPPPLAS